MHIKDTQHDHNTSFVSFNLIAQYWFNQYRDDVYDDLPFKLYHPSFKLPSAHFFAKLPPHLV